MKTHLTTDAGKEIINKKIEFNEVIYTIDLKKGELKKTGGGSGCMGNGGGAVVMGDGGVMGGGA
ncbi:TPR and ankyrin repeat-containing protein 1 [Bienertia sinuspersici]